MPAVNYYAIIVGGGLGTRMGSDIPKQFMLVHGKPVLMHTIEAFHRSTHGPQIIVVLSKDFHQHWNDLCVSHHFDIPHKLVAGGEQRFHSVKNGLKHINGPALIAIHDAVRPCVTSSLIDAAYKEASRYGSAIAAVKSRDSVRQLTQTGSISLNRADIYLVQTPQVFTSEILCKAYEQDYRVEFTDDASVVESSGMEIRLIEGETTNIKITYRDDLRVAEAYLKPEK